jgi:hypothetical protein
MLMRILTEDMEGREVVEVEVIVGVEVEVVAEVVVEVTDALLPEGDINLDLNLEIVLLQYHPNENPLLHLNPLLENPKNVIPNQSLLPP